MLGRREHNQTESVMELPMSFEPRLDMQRIAPDAYGAMRKLSDFVAGCGLELLLLELVMVRVSQMNGCGYCVDWHTRRARKQGELEPPAAKRTHSNVNELYWS